MDYNTNIIWLNMVKSTVSLVFVASIAKSPRCPAPPAAAPPAAAAAPPSPGPAGAWPTVEATGGGRKGGKNVGKLEKSTVKWRKKMK